MSDDKNEALIVFRIVPGDDPMSLAHQGEARRRRATFYNFGWVSEENAISSKTSKGILYTEWDALTAQWRHHWHRRD
jgi:hypothetical protein